MHILQQTAPKQCLSFPMRMGKKEWKKCLPKFENINIILIASIMQENGGMLMVSILRIVSHMIMAKLELQAVNNRIIYLF